MHETTPMVRTLRRIVWLAVLVFLFHRASTFAAAVGDQVELNATYQAGVPLHKEPRGTNDFQRVPDGTKATVIDVAQDNRWVKLSLPDGRTGWVSSRYVRRHATGAPSPGTSTAAKTPQRTEVFDDFSQTQKSLFILTYTAGILKIVCDWL